MKKSDLKKLWGKSFKELNDKEKNAVLESIASAVNASTCEEPEIGEECTIDFEDGLTSISGVMTEDGPIPNADSKFYSPVIL